MQINFYKGIYYPTVSDTLHISQVLLQIQSGKYSDTVSKCREIGKKNDKVKYDKLKESLPCVTFNFLFKGKKSNANIIGSTGLIYIDADDLDTFIPNKYVYACWRSVSGVGWGILVKVSGLQFSNYSITYDSVSKLIGLTNPDSCAKKATQYTILSYDSGLYFNENSITVEAEKVSFQDILDTDKEKKQITRNDTFFLDRTTTVNQLTRTLRWSNYMELFDRECNKPTDLWIVLNKRTTDYVEVFTLRNKISDGRKTSLKLFLNNILWLNTFLFLPEENNKLNGIVKNYCAKSFSKPLTEQEIDKIINDALKTKPKFIPAKRQRSILINKDLIRENGLNPRIVLNRAIGELRTINGELEIEEILINWDFEILGKITNTKVADQLGCAKLTIQRKFDRFPKLKELKTSLNKQHINQKQNEKE